MLRAFHDSTMGGHFGVPVTYRRLRHLSAWPKMKEHAWQYVQSCYVCQHAKPERVCYPGLLEPLPIPDGAWKVVTMDFIDGLLLSGKYNCIHMVDDKFTRYAQFLPLSHPFTVAKVAHAYLENIYKLQGLPEAIVETQCSPTTSGESCSRLSALNST